MPTTGSLPTSFEHRPRPGMGTVTVRFLGREHSFKPADIDATHDVGISAAAFLDQTHSALVLEAREGSCGQGDGLWTDRTGLALCVVTADCAPVVITDGRRLAVLHAGWRGVAARIVSAAHSAMRPEQGFRAWIGPSIGPCCYEVGADVAEQLAAVSAPSVLSHLPDGRLYADLGAALAIQLSNLGAGSIDRVALCTCCHPDILWSYRHHGESAERNLSLAWMESD